MSVKSTTDNLGLIKYSRGHSVRDTDLATNMDAIDAAYQCGVKVAKGDITGGAANAFAFAWNNPESTAILVQKVIIDITTAGGTATSVMDVGVAASATGTDDTIFDGIDLNSTGISVNTNVSDTGTNGDEKVHKVDENGGTNDWITGKILVEKCDNLVGKYYIEYVTV